MIVINPVSINDLVALHKSGVPVTLTSHPGNASLYKLSLWQCGIPEHFWDVTCCKADANNWPMHRLRDGKSELVVSDNFYHKVNKKTTSQNRFVTAYQRTKFGGRLGREHLRVCHQLFPEVISSYSRLLLSEERKLFKVLMYLAETKRDDIFTRRITAEGVLVPFFAGSESAVEIVDSVMSVLLELDTLLLTDDEIETKGGICFGGVIVQLLGMLVQFWKTGHTDRCDISGPDMINYSSSVKFQQKLSVLLSYLHGWNPELIPKNITIRMYDGTTARVGSLVGHVSEGVMNRKEFVLTNYDKLQSGNKKQLRSDSVSDESLWPIRIKSKTDCYFSQHDLLKLNFDFVVNDYWKGLPIDLIKKDLIQANAWLQI